VAPGPNRRAAGSRFEALAARHLEGLGYQILDRNYQLRRGELDLVARAPDGTICFVEVRARADRHFGAPEETVGAEKRRRIIGAARHYLAMRLGAEPPCRFDVIAVVGDDPATAKLEHLVDAFRVGD
jgi:putative endonuclease